MTTLRIDLETYSDVDLKKCGVHKYVESDNFEVMLFAYAFGDSDVNVIDLAAGEQIPQHVERSLHLVAVVGHGGIDGPAGGCCTLPAPIELLDGLDVMLNAEVKA